MAIKEKLAQAINKQINAELYSSYLYLSMAAHLAAENLAGFAKWLKVQSQEEYTHAMKLYGFLIERGGRVVLEKIDSPKTIWKSPKEAFEEIYAHEKKITSLINNLMALAKKEDD